MKKIGPLTLFMLSICLTVYGQSDMVGDRIGSRNLDKNHDRRSGTNTGGRSERALAKGDGGAARTDRDRPNRQPAKSQSAIGETGGTRPGDTARGVKGVVATPKSGRGTAPPEKKTDKPKQQGRPVQGVVDPRRGPERKERR
jgi:hypothetical protein